MCHVTESRLQGMGDYKGVMGDMNCGFRGTDRQKIEVVCIKGIMQNPNLFEYWRRPKMFKVPVSFRYFNST